MKRHAADHQGARDAAALLPIAATVLLLPPFILIFAAPAFVFGVPLIVAYVFGVWAVVIFAAWLVARRHAEASDGPGAAQETVPTSVDQP
ncbi:hypothetical protein [Bosea sp. (in: a-proteobacteria)]|uniref:hypothetical protein n=1 Tax=Bosea sp. (in: a-proteobacteria) TaxID=1871050 RepID=UPI002FC6D503